VKAYGVGSEGEPYNAYLGYRRACREAFKDRSLHVTRVPFRTWLRMAVRPPALFIAFVVAVSAVTAVLIWRHGGTSWG